MKLQQIQNLQQIRQQKQDKNQSFKGAGDAFLRYLATNQAIGANAVDFSFMVVPRTTTDFVNRGPAAGLETGRREASGTVNHSLIGVYGAIAGALTAAVMGFKDKFGTGVNNIVAAPETLNILAEAKAQQLKADKHQIDYLKEILRKVKAYNPTAEGAKDGFVNLGKETIDEIATILDRAINNKDLNFKKWDNKKLSDSFQVVINKILEKTGAESRYILEGFEGQKASETTLKALIEDIYKVSEAFNRPQVNDAFKEQIAKNKNILENSFIKSLTKFNKTKAIAGFAIGSLVGMSIQPLNIYLTKLKTGSDGFVGVEGREKDKSAGFFALKTASAAAFFTMVMATLKTGFKGFFDKMAFKGFWPTLNQLKGIYGLTIVSRLIAARDKDELRESLTKDTLGFLSWLVLGDIVNKLTASALDDAKHTVFNSTEKETKGLWQSVKRAFNSSLKTRDEILIETLASKNVKATKVQDGKVIAKTFKELMKDLETLPDGLKEITKKRLSTLNKAQLAGYAFSGLVLGIGIPKLNIWITNSLDKKRKAKAAEAAQAAENKQVEVKPQEVKAEEAVA